MPTNKTVIKTGVMRRRYEIRKEDVSEEQRTVALTFSSEQPYDRWFGTEILDHGKKSVLLDRLNTGGPLLVDHDTRDQVGVVEEAKIGTDRRGRAVVRLGKSQRAEEIFRDIADGIRKNISVGYRVHQMQLESAEGENQEQKTYRVTKWEPLEVSVVAVPADNSVGIGRADDTLREFETEVIEPEIQTRALVPAKKENTMPEPIVEQVVDLAVERDKVRKEEQKRVREILAYGEQFKCAEEAKKAVDDGTPLDQFRHQVLERLGKIKPVETDPAIGMTPKEVAQFSILDGIRAICDPRNAELQKKAGLVFEASRAFAAKIGKAPRSFFVPPDVLFQRDISGLTDAAGGYLVGTQHVAASFIEMLRNRMVLRQAGATIMDGLMGDIAIPKQTGGATAYWVAENSAVTESNQTFGQLALAPKTVGAFTDLSRKLIIQSAPSAEVVVRNDLSRVLAIEIDRVGLHGTGVSPQPAGIAATSGIGSVVGGTNGKTITYAHVVGLETEVAQDNADVGAVAYITNPKVRAKLKQIFTNATYGEIPVWQDGQGVNGVGRLNGYPAYVTSQVSSTLTKGNQSLSSAVFFGNWADLVIAFWSGLDILVDPYTGSSAGTVRVVAMQDVDLGVRHAESFAAMLDALTV